MENSNNKKIFRGKILFKIYLVWFFRRILPLMIVQVAVAVFAVKIFANNVFVSKVLGNIALVADKGYWEVFKYLIEAFRDTHLIIQVAILIGLGLIALLLRDIIRIILTYTSIRREK